MSSYDILLLGVISFFLIYVGYEILGIVNKATKGVK